MVGENPEVAINVAGLAKTFGEVRALDGLDLQIEAGTVFGLLGPNGAGKTTLVRVLATLLEPTSGRAEILGHDVVREPLAVRRRIGLAGQFAAVDGELTGRENVDMIARLYRMSAHDAARRASEVLERFGLDRRGGPACRDVLRRDAPPARPRRRADRRARRSFCSTSRRPALTRALARNSGPSSTNCAAMARRCC